MDELVSLCKRRGFIFQSSEIYGGLQGMYDFVPLGVELKNNFPQADISLISSGGGVFEISLNDNLIFSKKALNRFPESGEIKKLIMDRLE